MDESQTSPVELFRTERGRGFPLILLHGYPLDHTIWDPVTAQIEDGAWVIAPDLRGFGKTQAPPGVYTMRLMASDVARMMDELQIEKAVLAGHSMGGYIVLAFAEAFPERIAGIGLVATHPAADTPEGRQERYATVVKVDREGVEGVAESMPPRLTAKPQLQDRVREIILRTKPEGIAGALKGMAERADMSTILPTLAMPGVVIAGEMDTIVPVEKAREMADALPRAQLVLVPGGRHLLMMEAPGVVAQALNQLMTDVRNMEAAKG